MIRLDGTVVASARKQVLAARIEEFRARLNKKPGLAVVLVGEDPASQVYVRNKEKTTVELGMESVRIDLPADTSEAKLLAKIRDLNDDPRIHGILVQLPLPKHLSVDRVLETISPEKDPDGLTFANMGLLWAGKKRIAPCTPWGVMAILEYYGVSVVGKNAVVIGRSNIVGKPMAQLLMDANATVTICHSKTPDMFEYTRRADIVVVAAGQARFIGKDAFKRDAVVIDVGIHRPTEGDFAGKLCGDVRYEELDGHVYAATPVPKGVGPMTIQMLMENTLRLAEMKELNQQSRL